MNHHKAQSGFSLVETLVAITILLIVIVGPLTIVSTTSNSTSFSNEQVIAFYLAQEGAELAQKARDDYILDRFAGSNPNAWDDFIDESLGAEFEDCFTANGCGLEIGEDPAVGTVEVLADACNPVIFANPCVLRFDDDAGNIRSRYTYDTAGNDRTIYSRAITFENMDPGGTDEIRVVSTVTWISGLTIDEQSVEVVTYLFDVYGN